MAGMSHAAATSATQQPPGRLDGPVLVSNLVAGGFLLGVLAVSSWPLALMGATYVAAASVFLAAVYARPALRRSQEAAAWVALWVAAIALWTGVLVGIAGPATWFLNARIALVIATPSYVGWQALALAVRQLLASRARPSSA